MEDNMKKRHVFISADIHGDSRNLLSFITKERQKHSFYRKDTIILLGDSGFLFFLNDKDKRLKEKVNSYGVTIFNIRGNHDQRPSLCMKESPELWHMEEYWGNQVYVENDYPYIKYALDEPAIYEIPTIYEKNIKTLVLPGAYSVDKWYRLERGGIWNPYEQCDEKEREKGLVLATSAFDLVLSHTCPVLYEPSDLFLPMIDQNTVDKTTEKWLNEIEKDLEYKLWTFGHFHSLRIYPPFQKKQMIMLYNTYFLDLYKYLFGEYKSIEECIINLRNF